MNMAEIQKREGDKQKGNNQEKLKVEMIQQQEQSKKFVKQHGSFGLSLISFVISKYQLYNQQQVLIKSQHIMVDRQLFRKNYNMQKKRLRIHSIKSLSQFANSNPQKDSIHKTIIYSQFSKQIPSHVNDFEENFEQHPVNSFQQNLILQKEKKKNYSYNQFSSNLEETSFYLYSILSNPFNVVEQ